MEIQLFSSTLKQSNHIKDLTKALDVYLSDFGFQHYAFTYYSHHIKTGRKLKYDYVSPPLKPWHDHYLEQKYADVDQTLEKSYLEAIPTPWDLKTQLENSKNKREKRIREESIEFGIDKGLSIPIYGPKNDFASLTLHQFKNENCLEGYEVKQFEWLSAAHFFYHYLKKLLEIDSEGSQEVFNLTKREKQCLKYTALSWRVESIGKELNITPRTVNLHLQNAMKKLGTNNK